MYLRTVLIIFLLALLALFTAVNWNAIITPTTLSLVFATIEAPLGLILLGLVVLLAALFLLYVVYLQSSVLIETRRHARELHAQRELAEQAEHSRFHELRGNLENHIQSIAEQGESLKTELVKRLDALELNTRSAIAQCENTVAAYMAELDDRLQRAADESRTLPKKLRVPIEMGERSTRSVVDGVDITQAENSQLALNAKFSH